ncbi:MAG: hypothetical protein QJR09_04225 [Micrococcus sp.]|nr:hypothetical protein [Micrococcus sp.]
MSKLAEGRSGRVGYRVPDDWEITIPEAEGVDSLALQVGPEGTFAPNVVVTVNDYTGSIAGFCLAAMDHLRITLEDTVIVDVLPWSPGGTVTPDGMAVDGIADQGRVIVYTHRSPRSGTRLRGAEWLTVQSGTAVQMTSTAQVSQWPVFASLFSEIASSITVAVRSEAEGTGPGSPADDLPEASRDTVLGELTGTVVEQLHGLAEFQRYTHQGIRLRGEAFALFTELADGKRIGRLDPPERRSAARELEEAGLAGTGGLSEAGDTLATFLQQTMASLRITAAFAGGSSAFHAWVAGNHALTVAGPGYTDWLYGTGEDSPAMDEVTLAVVPLMDLTTEAARWVGLQPAWNLPVFPSACPQGLIDGRWAGIAPPPEDASPTLRILWEEQWFAWTVEARGPESTSPAQVYLNGGRMGHYAWGRAGEDIVMIPTAGVTVLDRFEEMLQASLFGREARIH